MSKKKDPKKLIVFLILVISYFFYNNFTPNTENFGTSVNKGSDTTSTSLTVSFVDVGQADCTSIENAGKYALIDAGNNEDGPLLVKYFESLGIKEFECVFATHAHEDHIGGMDDIINNFKIKMGCLLNIPFTKIMKSIRESIPSFFILTNSKKKNIRPITER